ncbi:MAG: outer membrane beta-barrel protein [Bacteroidota bacterium]
MKRLLKLALFLSLIVNAAESKSLTVDNDSTKFNGIYFGVEGGYGFSACKSTFTTPNYTNGLNTDTKEYNVVIYSLGKGFNAGAFVGYTFTKHLSAELSASYLASQQFKFYSALSEGNKNLTLFGTMYRLIPTLKLTLGEHKLKMYSKAGFIIGLGTKVTMYEESNTMNTNNNIFPPWQDTRVYTGGLSYGFKGGLGASYMFTNKIGVFAELTGFFQSYSPKKSVETSMTVLGADYLPFLTTYDKETDYVTSYALVNNPDRTQPQQDLKFYFPFSSVGFTIGVKISFEKEKPKKG